MVSQKQYRETAVILNEELRRTQSRETRVALVSVAYGMAAMFQRDNSRFDQRRFLAAVRDDVDLVKEL